MTSLVDSFTMDQAKRTKPDETAGCLCVSGQDDTSKIPSPTASSTATATATPTDASMAVMEFAGRLALRRHGERNKGMSSFPNVQLLLSENAR